MCHVIHLKSVFFFDNNMTREKKHNKKLKQKGTIKQKQQIKQNNNENNKNQNRKVPF